MSKIIKSNLWMPEILRISGLFRNKKDNNLKGLPDNNHSFWDIYKKSVSDSSIELNKGACLPLTKSKFIKDAGKYFYWNRNPNMIIDLDWFELNRKKPCNVILTAEKKQ